MIIELYNNASEPKTINKLLSRIKQIEGNFRESVNIQDPDIMIESTVFNSDCNYIKIVDLDRYYFITSIESLRNNITILHCHIDVLKTYQTALLNCYGLINRAENKDSHNKYVFDNNFVPTTPLAHIAEKFDMTDAGTLGIQTVLLTCCGAEPLASE